MSDGGKGSSPRPFSVSHEEWSNRWDAIFQRDIPEKLPKEVDDALAEDEAFALIERQKREKALDEMVRISEELGLYDESDSPNRNTSNF